MKRGIQFAGVMLLALALACLHVGAVAFHDPSGSSVTKIWECILFSPYQTYPTQVKKYRRRPPGTAASDEDRLSGILPGDGWIRGISGRMKSSTETRRKRWWRQRMWNDGAVYPGKRKIYYGRR